MLRVRLSEATLALVATLLTGCCFFPTASSCDERCAAEGACTVRTHHAGDGAWICYAASDADCQRSQPCRDRGRCYAAEDGTCVEASEVASRACAISEACRERGACRARDGICESQRPEDCTESTRCRVQGRCTLDPPTGGCFVTPESCAASEDCAARGLCGYERDPFGGRYGTCVSASVARPPVPPSSTPSDRLTRLRTHLSCGGSRGAVERQVCFHEIVQLFDEWPLGRDREDAFAEATRELHLWSDLFREVHAGEGESLVYDDASQTVRDTLGLVRTLRVRRYDDDVSAPPLSALLRSTYGRDLSALYVTDTPLSFDELAHGPAAARLGALVLNGAIPSDAPWDALASWPGLATLQFLQLGGSSASNSSSERLWELLEHAPAFAGLRVEALDFGPFMDRVDAHPAVAHRLEQLSLRHSHLRDDHLPRLIAATALDRLATLDLRQNDITCDGLAMLRRAPQFQRGTILIDRDCP